MTSQIQPIKVWGQGGPNPPKVAILVKELDIPHEIVNWPLSDVKKPEYTAINPNGRIPAIEDPNTNLTLWESGAIVEYIIEKYDTQHKLSFPTGSNESYLAKQWLYYQVSGQGPYYGQAVWFHRYHSEKVPTAVERYIKEINRVTSVLEGHLAKQSSSGDGPWLVGDKMSYADLAFVPWQLTAGVIFGKDGYNVDDYPHVKQWMDKMTSRPVVKQVIETAFKR